jgi:FdhD protein
MRIRRQRREVKCWDWSVTKIDRENTIEVSDSLVVEEPLEMRVNGEPFVTLMRTPGEEIELVTGFLVTEGIVDGVNEIASIDYANNIVNIILKEGRVKRRLWPVRSSCSICSSGVIESLKLPVIMSRLKIEKGVIETLSPVMNSHCKLFAKTGATHSAGIFTKDGKLLFFAEDIGRHNALDKVIGASILKKRSLKDKLIVVSSRSSYEMTAKAAKAGVPVLVSFSAPSSLSCQIAKEHGLTLIWFLKDGKMNIYTHSDRILLD